jgi:hypothetical protein
MPLETKTMEEQLLQSLIYNLRNPSDDAFDDDHILDRPWLQTLSASMFEKDGTLRDEFTTTDNPKDILWLL